MDNPTIHRNWQHRANEEKKTKKKQKTAQYVLDTIIGQQTQITKYRRRNFRVQYV